MCGICGIAFQGQPFDKKRAIARVKSMLDALAHRGPNASGMAMSPPAAVGASRLAIRGLDSGRQPFHDEKSGVMVVCNGEIDNHRELRRWLESRGRTVAQQTDIAVIPELYLELGENFVERLVGVFAIAIWDPGKEELLLTRDRAGERPIFFTIQEGVVQFATEVAALVGESGATFTRSREAIHEYLATGCLAAPASPYREVQKVRPGEVVTIRSAGIRRRRYWRWAIGQVKKAVPSAGAFDSIFREAVRSQTDIDVPFGVFLSGGLDSSLIAAVARDLRPDAGLPAYCLRFKEKSYDEGGFALQVAHRLGLEPIPVWVNPMDLPKTLTDLVGRVGEPLADPAWIPTALLAGRAAQDVKLVLAGEGGDELFGGYPTHLAAKWGEIYACLPQGVQNVFRHFVDQLPMSDKKVTLSYLLKRFVGGMHHDGIARHILWKANISPAVMSRLGLSDPFPRKLETPTGELLDCVQRLDLEITLAEGLLTKSDRAGMRSALEVRAPFLDQRVMEFAATLPVNERVRGLTTKVFLKKYAERYLPRSIIYRRKRGLSVPLSLWLRGPLYDWALSRVGSGRLADVGINVEAAVKLLEEHRRREADHARALWSLIVLCEWLAWDEARIRRAF
jgi:asparagine synthase (glutamine-hydrolysing)